MVVSKKKITKTVKKDKKKKIEKNVKKQKTPKKVEKKQVKTASVKVEKKPSKKTLLNIEDQLIDTEEVETKEIKFNAKNSKDLEKQLSEEDDLITDVDGDEDIEGPKDADLEALEEEEEEQGIRFNQVDIFEGVSLDDPVRMYLKEIGQYNLLSTEIEQKLTKEKQDAQVLLRKKKFPITLPVEESIKIRLKPEELKTIKKGELSQQRLIECNLRLVVSIAKKYIGHGLSLLDLIQEGNLGLIRGIEKFDYKMGFKLSTYVTWWIRQAVSRALADQSKTIRIPVHMVETINRLNKIKKNLINKLGFEPSIKQIAKEMHISEEKVEEIMQIAQDPVSLDKPVGDEDDSIVADFIADQNVISPEVHAERVMLKEQIRDLLEGLKDREKKVLMLRFGIDDDHPRTLEEVGKELNVTRERIRQIEDKALRKLKYRAGNLQQLVK